MTSRLFVSPRNMEVVLVKDRNDERNAWTNGEAGYVV